MSANLLAQIPGITEMPLHQIAILDATLNGRSLSNEHLVVIPIPKDNSFELVTIRMKMKVDWETGKDKLEEFDNAVEEFIGRPIGRHEKSRYIGRNVIDNDFRQIPFLLYYRVKLPDGTFNITSTECWLYKVHKEVLEIFQEYYFKNIKTERAVTHN